MHLDLDDAVALAGFASAPLDVEREATGFIAARLRFGQTGEPFADRRERSRIGRGVGARGAADGRLVDINNFIEPFNALDPVMRARMVAVVVQLLRDGFVQRFDNQRGFAAARDPGHTSKGAEWDIHIDPFEVVVPRTDDADLAASFDLPPGGGQGNFHLAGKIFASDAFGGLHDVIRRPLRNQAAAVTARARAHIHHMIGGQDCFLVMFDNNHAVALIAQVDEGLEQPRIIPLMQPDGGLVQHIENAGQAGADLRGEADTLALSA